MGTRPRLPTNVIDSLEDITAVVGDTWPAVEAASRRAREQMDAAMLAHLNEVTTALARIERYTRAARRGEYAGKR